MGNSLTAREKAHVKFCRDTRCIIEGQAGKNCLNLDFTLDRVEEEAVRKAAQPAAKDEYALDNGDFSMLRIALLVPPGQSDTQNPNLPGSPTIRPERLMLTLYPQDGVWVASTVQVLGPRVHAVTGNLTKRSYSTSFMNPGDPDTEAPDWVIVAAQVWEDKLNGVTR
jgi:hypothetical protein